MCRIKVAISSSREWWVNSYWIDFYVVGGILNLDKARGMPCHAWDRGGLVCTAWLSHQVSTPLPQADSPPSLQVVLLLSRVVRWSNVIIRNSAAAKEFQRVSAGTTWMLFKRWVGYPRRGVKRRVDNVIASNETHKRVRNVLCAWKNVWKWKKMTVKSRWTKGHERVSS